MGKYLVIDGEEFRVGIVDLTRKGDILDKTANRTEDGDLHREVIGTYYNYTMTIRPGNDVDTYNRLFEVLTAPVPYHEVQLPNDDEVVQMYFGSVTDKVRYIAENGTAYYKDLTCNLVCKKPRRYA